MTQEKLNSIISEAKRMASEIGDSRYIFYDSDLNACLTTPFNVANLKILVLKEKYILVGIIKNRELIGRI